MTALSTRERLKLSARRLFAQRGIDGVSVRDIVLSAGQKNAASLHYYFRTKERLVRELVADGAKLIDERRNRRIDELEARGGPIALREIIEALVWPSTALAGAQGEEDTYLRFIAMMQMSHRDLFLDSLEGKWASGYRRCLDHVRLLLPELSEELLNQRLVFMSLYLTAVLSAREAALAGARNGHRFWSADSTLDNFVDTIEGLLGQKRSTATAQALERAALKHPRKRNVDVVSVPETSVEQSRGKRTNVKRTVSK